MREVRWHWPKADWAGGSDGSVMGKLFRGGSLADEALLAREALQNSTDANQRFCEQHPATPLTVRFRFVSLLKEDKREAVTALDLPGLAAHRSKYRRDPLQSPTALDRLEDPNHPLNILYVEDFGTHGLSGHPRLHSNSHLFKAMYYIGSSTKGAGEGGSYGFGKSALLRASRTRTVIAHSTFVPSRDDPIHTRLVGFTWWTDLDVGGEVYEGRGGYARFNGEQREPIPFEDNEATEIAQRLGFAGRGRNNPNECGTSFLIVDPVVTPAGLLREVSRWWWPALEDHRLDVQVVHPNGQIERPEYATDPFIRQFLRPYRIAQGLETPSDPNRERLPSKGWRNRGGTGGQDLGELALVAPEAPVSESGEDSESGSLVALMRGPRMIVQYLSLHQQRVPLRGVFIASERANAILRETEPATHDRWTTNPSPDVSENATSTANALLKKIRHSVRQMASEIAPPPPKVPKTLRHFSRLMQGLLVNRTGNAGPPQVEPEPIELTFPKGRPSPETLDDQLVQLRTQFAIRVGPSAPGPACMVNVKCELRVLEDDSATGAILETTIRPVRGGQAMSGLADGAWEGVLTGDRVVFEAVSAPYPNVWTVILRPIVSRIGEWSEG